STMPASIPGSKFNRQGGSKFNRRRQAKPTFSVPSEHFVSFQGEMSVLPELRFNGQDDSDDIWLSVPRLHEIAPPPIEIELNGWVKLPKTPSALPEIVDETARTKDGEVWMERLADRPDIQDLFDWFVNFQWKPWASAEAPRRKTMSLYKRLFSVYQTIASEGSETPLELVWGIGNAAWKKAGHSTPVRYPVILQLCEISLNETTFELEIRPRDADPKLELDCYTALEVPGVAQLETYWKAHLEAGVERPNPFEPSSYESLLNAAVTHLDAGGSYQHRTDNLSEPTPRDTLQVTNTWVLFARNRSGDIFVEDVRRLKANLEIVDELPGVISAFVQHGSDDVKAHASRSFRGLSNSDAVNGGFELYFPMPYNDEQVSIVQKLEANHGVVVQGPPGTGKTHTIANVICHYLAQGKRVLVTAKSETALAVLQDKLPDEIRPLSVALLSDERDGMRQFEHSIETIAGKVASLIDSRSRSTIAAAENKLNELHAKICHVDAEAANFARSHMQTYTFQGRKVTPEEMAKLVMEQGDEHNWLDDDLPAAGETLAFDDGAIGALRNARIRVGSSLPYLTCSLPQAPAFPAWGDLLGIHRDLVKAQEIDAEVQDGSLLGLVDSTSEIFERARLLDELLKARADLIASFADAPPWVTAAGAKLASLSSDDPLVRIPVNVTDDSGIVTGLPRNVTAG
ncbi:AAA domain-containing protein, partial [Variovorax sp. RTB1]|uniref:AAA domain-containing protein n=1 Tax=Variovorax sp. RTB1 TaxID=3048631 RepID=UPI002B2340FA